MKSISKQVGTIEWYCESGGSGPPVVLIPSGEGDCGSYGKVAEMLSGEFTVLTFDMPGFSRSSAPRDFATYSTTRAADDIVELVRALGMGPATIYGCSSGGQIALCLALDHPDVVRKVVVHEVPLAASPYLAHMVAMNDDEIVRLCQDLFRNQLNEDGVAWDSLGDGFHERLRRNYVTWVRRYVGNKHMLRTFVPDDLSRLRLTWTIGGLSPAVACFDNIMLAHASKQAIGLLMCRHFPQVSIPRVLAEHIGRVARA